MIEFRNNTIYICTQHTVFMVLWMLCVTMLTRFIKQDSFLFKFQLINCEIQFNLKTQTVIIP